MDGVESTADVVTTEDSARGHLSPSYTVVVTSALSLARQLWRYGEPELAARAASLEPADVVDVGIRAVALGEAAELWPAGPRYPKAALVLATVELLEGAPRPPRRSRRLPERSLPIQLQATETQLWDALKPVDAELDHRRRKQ